MANEQAGQVHGMTAAHSIRNYGGSKYQQKFPAYAWPEPGSDGAGSRRARCQAPPNFS